MEEKIYVQSKCLDKLERNFQNVLVLRVGLVLTLLGVKIRSEVGTRQHPSDRSHTE